MKQIVFTDLGRDKWCGRTFIGDNLNAQDISEVAYHEALKHLASKYPDVEYDAETNRGTVSAGYRTVGTFHVE